jgi:thymidylate kinase
MVIELDSTAEARIDNEHRPPDLFAMFAAFEQNGIRWCLLRGDAHGHSDGDIDVLIDPPSLPRARALLASFGLTELPHQGYGWHFAVYDRSENRWVSLHAIGEWAFGPRREILFPDAAGCLARRVYVDSLPRLAAGDEFWALLLHCILDKPHIAAVHRERLREIATYADARSAFARHGKAIWEHRWSAEFMVDAVCRGEWTALEAYGAGLVTAWNEHRRRQTIRRASRGARALLRYPRVAWRRRGLTIALLGPDGAGKSTLARGLRESFIFPARTVYMGLTGGLLPRADRLRLPPLVVPARLLIFWIRYLLAQYHKARGRLVIFDRYIYDAMVPHPERLNWLRRCYRWIDGHSCPAPDLVIVLNAPGEVMHQRKGEYNPSMLDDWRQHFLALQGRVRGLQVVDTTQSKDEVLGAVIEMIWQHYRQRWSTAHGDKRND